MRDMRLSQNKSKWEVRAAAYVGRGRLLGTFKTRGQAELFMALREARNERGWDRATPDQLALLALLAKHGL